MPSVSQIVSAGVHPWIIRTKGLNSSYQRTYCPFCQTQIVEYSGHRKVCKEFISVVRSLEEKLNVIQQRKN